MLCTQQIAAIVIVLVVAVFISSIFPSVREALRENAKFKNKRVAHIPFQLTPCNEKGNTFTMHFDLKVDYPHGILTVDDIIKISGVVDASSAPFNIDAVAPWFSSAQVHPETRNDKGITELAPINFHKTQERNIMIADETEMKWPIEGEYHLNFILPVAGGQPVIKTLDNPTITVHPRSVWLQVLTNEAITNITIATLFLGIVGAFDIVFRLWTAP